MVHRGATTQGGGGVGGGGGLGWGGGGGGGGGVGEGRICFFSHPPGGKLWPSSLKG